MNEEVGSNNEVELDELVDRLHSDDPTKRIEFINMLTDIKDNNSLDYIVKFFEDEAKEVRLAAIKAAGETKDPKGIAPLKKLLDNKEGETRKQAKYALYKIYEKSLKDSFSDIRADAAEELGRLDNPKAVEPLVELLDDTYSWVREASAWALGEIGDVRCVEALLETLNDDKPLVRRAAAKSLGVLGYKEASIPLIKLLRDPDYEVREASAWALGEVSDPKAVPELRKVLEDSRKEVREAAAASINKLKTAKKQ